MAPALSPLSGLNGGTASTSPFAARAILAAQAGGSGGEIRRVSMSMDSHGDFNGSCSAHQANPIPPETPAGSCASYFADVTDYCCAAVGGVYDANFTASNASSMMAPALDHPICRTTNYVDMFSCYQFVTEAHCSGTTPVPYGVCSRNSVDTSNAMRSSSSAAAGVRPAQHVKWAGVAFAVLLVVPLSLLA